jgi:leucyl aminopeptidase
MPDKTPLIQADRDQQATLIHLIDKAALDGWLSSLSAAHRASLAAQKFTGAAGSVAIVSGASPAAAKSGQNSSAEDWFAVGGVKNTEALTSYCLSSLAEKLPQGTYRIAQENAPGKDQDNAEARSKLERALFGWQSAQYAFDRYKAKPKQAGARVLLTKHLRAIDGAIAEAEAVSLVRDLVNTPAEDMGPAALEEEAERLAKTYEAKLSVVRGDALEQDYPMVHAVGRAASRKHAPRLIHLTWGQAKDPVLAVVGKGVAFDSGGLDIKSAVGMRLMKKDMGGAAHALALAQLIMGAGLPVQLHLIIPAVENAISGNAFRPGDVLSSRKGLSVEIGNTDAEGRLILGDALTRASEEKPDLILDFATLTGAARIALGPDYPALMAREDSTAEALIAAGKACDDEPWRLPLPDEYREWLKSDIADLGNISGNPYAGASVAGLFLDRFVDDGIDWAHFDTFAWRPSAKPGRPKGGAAYGLRAAWGMLQQRYGKS